MKKLLFLITICISASNIVAQTKQYQLITDVNDIVSGGKYLIVGIKSGDYFALGYQNTNNRPGASINPPSANIITTQIAETTSDQTNPYEITITQNNNDYTLFDHVNNRYLRPATGSGNNFLQGNTTAVNWTINFNGNIANIIADGTGSIYERPVMQHNITGSNNLFACYQSNTQSPVYLYKEIIETSSSYIITFDDILRSSTFTENCKQDSSITLPYGSYCENSLTYTFAGWSETQVSETASPPTLFYAGQNYMPTGNKTLYAVYSKTTGSGNFYLVKTTPSNWEGEYMFVNSSPAPGKTNAMANTFYASGELNTNNTFTNSNDTITTTDNTIVWTVTATATSDQYYIHNSAGYLKITGTGSTNAALTINPEDAFTFTLSATAYVYQIISVLNDDRCFSYYSSNMSFRTYSTSGNNTGYIYKKDAIETIYSSNVVCDYQYKLVTNVNDMISGEKYLIVGKSSNDYKALGYQKTSGSTHTNRDGAAINAPDVNNIITVANIATNSSNITDSYEIEISHSENGYTLYDIVNNRYLRPSTNNTNNYIQGVTNPVNWTISFNENVANIIANGNGSSYSRPVMQYNGGSNNLFACYATTSLTPVYLYQAISNKPKIYLTNDLTNFQYYCENGPSEIQSFTVTGKSLLSDILLTSNQYYEISLDGDSNFETKDSILLSPINGDVNETTIYVRLKAGLAPGTYNNQIITASSLNVETKTATCNGSVIISSVGSLLVDCETQTSVGLSWDLPEEGGYDGIIIAIRQSSGTNYPTTPTAINPETLTANSVFGSGSSYGTGPAYIVYKGTGTSVTITGLTQGLNYRISAYVYYDTNWDSDNGIRVAIDNLGINNVSNYNRSNFNEEVTLSWVLPNTDCFDEVMIVCKHNDHVTAIPSGNNSEYIANTSFGDGYEIENDEYIVYRGTGTILTISNLINEEIYYAKIFVRVNDEWSTGLELMIKPANVTRLEFGDLAILAINTNLGNNDDKCEISFVVFKDITAETSIDFTDNGYDRLYQGYWGTTEGVIRLTRTGATIPAGTVITINTYGRVENGHVIANIHIGGELDNENWIVESLNTAFYTFNINSEQDQIWMMQGGEWLTEGTHKGIYTGQILYGWTADGWKTSFGYNSTYGSTVPSGLECANTNVIGVANKTKVKYTGTMTTASSYEWIARVNTPSNWTGYSNNASFSADGPQYKNEGAVLSIDPNAGEFGLWTGIRSNSWCDCSNWRGLRVPTSSTNVEIPAVIDPASHYLFLSNDIDSLAYCNNLNIFGNVSNIENAKLFVNGNLTFENNCDVNFHNNIDVTVGGNVIVNSDASIVSDKMNLIMNKTGNQNIISSQILTVNNILFINSGTKTLNGDILCLNDFIINDNTVFNAEVDSKILVDKDFKLLNNSTMSDNCLNYLDIHAISDSVQYFVGDTIKTLSFISNKNKGSIQLNSNLIAKDDLIAHINNDAVFADNGNTILTNTAILDGDETSNYNLTGTLKMTGSGTIFNHNVNDNVVAKLHNLELTNADTDIILSTTTDSKTLTIKNNLILSDNSILNANNNNFDIGGNYLIDQHSTFDVSNSIININGTENQKISINQSNYTFTHLELNNTSGTASIEITNPTSIDGSVEFNNGIIYFTNNGSLTFENTATWNGGSKNSFVKGKVTRIGDNSLDFPLGDIAMIGSNMLNIYGKFETISESGSANITAEYIHSKEGLPNGQHNSGNLEDNIHHTSALEYWTVSSNKNLSNVTIHWQDNDNCINHNDYSQCIHGFCTASNIGNISNSEYLTIVMNENNGNKWKDLEISQSNITHNVGYMKSNLGITFETKSSESEKIITFGTKDASIPLPVELIYFNGNCINSQINFNWLTASENNSDYYIIEVGETGETGETENIKWKEIGKVKAVGNSNSRTNYTYTYNVKPYEQQYYQLKQIDIDGKYSYSAIIYVNCTTTNSNITVFPNPFDGISFNIESNIEIIDPTITIFDITGKTIKELKTGNILGTYNMLLNSKLDAGIYTIKIKSTISDIEIYRKLMVNE